MCDFPLLSDFFKDTQFKVAGANACAEALHRFYGQTSYKPFTEKDEVSMAVYSPLLWATDHIIRHKAGGTLPARYIASLERLVAEEPTPEETYEMALTAHLTRQELKNHLQRLGYKDPCNKPFDELPESEKRDLILMVKAAAHYIGSCLSEADYKVNVC